LRADLRDPVRHAGAASDAVDESARALQHAVQDALRRRHLPEHVHVEATLAVRALVGDLRLMDPARDRVADQLLVTLAARPAVIELRLPPALLVEAVGIDAREGADPARGRPGARALAVRDRDALAAFHQRQHLAPGNH